MKHIFIDSYLASYLASPLHRLNLWTPHASKQLEIIIWFHTNDISVHSSQNSLTYQMLTMFSKEHVISESHPDNLVKPHIEHIYVYTLY